MQLGDILELTTARVPDRTAVIAGSETITYRELLGRCHRLSAALSKVARPGDRVALLGENVPEVVEAYYGVPSAGMTLTFLNYRLASMELAWILNNCGATVLIAEAHLLEPLRPVLDGTSIATVAVVGGPEVTAGTRWHEVSYADFVSAASPHPAHHRGTDREIAWLLYTSGTTGFPKGAMLSHRNLVMSTLNASIECSVREDDRALMSMPLCHISSHMLFAYHLRGATVVLQRRYQAEEWMELVDTHGITTTALAPTLAIDLLNHPDIDAHRLDSFRRVVAGAGAMPVTMLRRLIDRFGPVICSAYGSTELAGSATQHPADAYQRAIGGEEQLLAACGKAMCLLEIKVVDEQFDRCPPGTVGEIVARGDQVTVGYWNDEEATKESFTGDWFHTGDLGMEDEEGFFYVIDRLKDMIKSGGENVYSREVEEALRHHPGVLDVAVIGLPDDRWGERVVAVVVPRDGAPLDTDSVLQEMRARLASFKLPKQFFLTNDLPRNVSGKVLKRELRSTYMDAR